MALALAGALAVATAAGLAVALVAEPDEPALDCAVDLERDDAALPELVPRDELTPAGTVGAQRQPTVEAFERLGAPFGQVVAGRFLRPGQPAPALLPLGDRLGLVSGPVLRVVDLPSGEVAWSVRLSAPLARGGPVGEQVTLLAAGPSPAVVTVAADSGDPEACADVPLAGPGSGAPESLVTDQAGTDVVVAAGRAATPVTLSRLGVVPPEEGSGAGTVWARELTGVTEADDVRVVGDDVVLSRVTDPARLAEMALAGGITRPLVTAYDVTSGEPTWTYPQGPPGERAATVVAEVADLGTVVVLEVSPGERRGVTSTEARLVALGPDGEVRWRRPLGTGLASGSRWGDRVVVQGPAPGGGARLRAYDLEGDLAWTLSTPDLPFGDERDNFGPPTTVGDELVVPSPNGLVALDPDSGEPRPLPLREPVDELVVVGEHLVVRSGTALLVMDLETGRKP